MSLATHEALAIQQRAMRDWVLTLGQSSPGASASDPGGLTAAFVPAVPRRSIVNSVVYTDPEALLSARDELARRYDDAGVKAWTVFVPEFDRETAAALERHGHALDGGPAAMVLELARLQAPELGDLDWDGEAGGDVAGAVNDLAYGAADGLSPGLVSPPTSVRQYQARVDSEVACVAGTIEHGDDLGFYFVATHPDHQRKGLTTRLMAAALVEARERGLRTSSLQASKMGEPVYRRLGYESPFSLRLYERRA